MRAINQIRDFNGVSRGVAGNPGEADKLEQKEVRTIDDLWRCVGVDFDTGITRVAVEVMVDLELLYALLIADSLGDSRHKIEEEPFRVRSIPQRLWLAFKRLWYARERHWLEAFLVAATLLLVSLAIRAGYLNPKITEQVVVKPSTRLLPWKSIRSEDVILKRIPEEEGAFSSLEQVVGRYPLRLLTPGTTVHQDQLVAEDLTGAVRERQVLSIPVNSRTLGSTLTTPLQVWLLISPRATGGENIPQPVLLKDVILLSIDKQGEIASIEVAVTEECLKKMEPLLGASETFVLQPIG